MAKFSFVHFARRLKNSFFARPSFFNSAKNSKRWDLTYFCPLRCCKANIVNCYFINTSPIYRLFFWCSPTNISRFIIAVIVNTVNRIYWRWSTSNIIKKCHKIIFPFIAYCYSTATVIFKCKFIRIKATCKYSPPCYIFRSFAHSMSGCSFLEKFLGQATAAFSVARPKFRAINCRYFTTSTLADPISSAPFVIFGSFKNNKTSEFLSDKINEIRYDKNLQAKVTSVLKCGKQLLEDCFSGMTLATK